MPSDIVEGPTSCLEFFNLDKMNKPDDTFVLCRNLEQVTQQVFNDPNMRGRPGERSSVRFSCLKVAIQIRLVDMVCVMCIQSLM